MFMVAELLHTVRITLRQHTLAAEPFLIVGLIAGIRRVLVLTAESTDRTAEQTVELGILVLLILVMSVAILVWRRSLSPVDAGSG
ncbi:MAG TPA: phosphate-starvation-inducible PsiE family protein [Candidatus Dormibacteraeota bacterium]|nr:phosphate-starvation-inducible PsiE family protein [Candidatus Dormibacteraeota bacterium]